MKKIILLSLFFTATSQAGFWSFVSTPFYDFFSTQKTAKSIIIPAILICATGVALYKLWFGHEKPPHDNQVHDAQDKHDDLIGIFHTIPEQEIIPAQYVTDAQQFLEEKEKKLDALVKLDFQADRENILDQVNITLQEIDSFSIRLNYHNFKGSIITKLLHTLDAAHIDFTNIYGQLGFIDNAQGINALFEDIEKRSKSSTNPLIKKIRQLLSNKIAKDNFDAFLQGEKALKRLHDKACEQKIGFKLITLRNLCGQILKKIQID